MPNELVTLVVTGPRYEPIRIVQGATSSGTPLLAAALSGDGRLELLLPRAVFVVIGGGASAVVDLRGAGGPRVEIALPVRSPAIGAARTGTGRGAPKAEGARVLTPGGLRAGTDVHVVSSGEAVRSGPRGLPYVTGKGTPSHGLAARRAKEGGGLVLTPGGFRPPSFVHRVGRGIAVVAAPGRVLLFDLASRTGRAVVAPPTIGGQPPPFGEGWIADTGWTRPTGDAISSFRTTWKVPPPPTTPGGQTIFLFNGIVNDGTPYGILQPVLQWGVSAAGGGPYWTIASWYVLSDGLAFHTALQRVEAGDTLVGVMELRRRCGDLCDYDCRFEGVPDSMLPVERISELTWANETLEAYGVSNCSDYPPGGATSMDAIEIRTGAITPALVWCVENRVVDCGQHAVVVTDGATAGRVDLHYR